jgi:hypothetical protein
LEGKSVFRSIKKDSVRLRDGQVFKTKPYDFIFYPQEHHLKHWFSNNFMEGAKGVYLLDEHELESRVDS